MFKKKLAVLSCRLRKAAAGTLMGQLASIAVQAASRYGHSWIGWEAFNKVAGWCYRNNLE